MTNWAPDYTPRAILKYRSAGLGHSWTLRFARGTDLGDVQADAASWMADFVTALESVLPTDFAVTEAFTIAQDTNIQIPFDNPVVVPDGAVDFTTMSNEDKARSLGFAGKSTLGLPGRLYIFGIAINPDTTSPGGINHGLLTAAEYLIIEDAVAALNNAPFVANDGAQIIFYQRATHKVNDYWWKQARKNGGL